MIAEASDFTEVVGVPMVVATIGLAATIGAAAVSYVLSRLGDAAERRRQGYAEATRELVAWAEYPYRIRRRTSDDPATLATIAELGHALQEALRYRETWITAENKWLAMVFAEVRQDLGALLGPACNEAWAAAPILQPSDMTLAGWGPVGVDHHLERFQEAVAWRFGWRRVLGRLGIRNMRAH